MAGLTNPGPLGHVLHVSHVSNTPESNKCPSPGSAEPGDGHTGDGGRDGHVWTTYRHIRGQRPTVSFSLTNQNFTSWKTRTRT